MDLESAQDHDAVSSTLMTAVVEYPKTYCETCTTTEEASVVTEVIFTPRCDQKTTPEVVDTEVSWPDAEPDG